MSDFDVTQVKALTFDVFGTVVNWRDSIIREGVKLSKAKGGLDVDWAEFADRCARVRAVNGAGAHGRAAVDEHRHAAQDDP